MLSPSARTPAPPLPLPPLREERTSVAPYPWLRRWWAAIASVVPLLGGFMAWAEGHLLEGMRPAEAIRRLGVPTAIALGAVLFVVYLIAIWVPQRDALKEASRQRALDDAREREERSAHERQLLMESHAADRAAWLATQQEQTATLAEIATQMHNLGARLDGLERAVRRTRGEETTDPAAPAARSPAGLGARRG